MKRRPPHAIRRALAQLDRLPGGDLGLIDRTKDRAENDMGMVDALSAPPWRKLFRDFPASAIMSLYDQGLTDPARIRVFLERTPWKAI